MKRSEVIAEARSWIGTPFHHQQCLKGHGCDCAQFVLGVAVALRYMADPGSDYRRYSRQPQPRMLRERLERHMDRIAAEEARPGDVVWIWWRNGISMHLGFLTDIGILHAVISEGGIIEQRLTDEMRSRIESYWRFRGLEED